MNRRPPACKADALPAELQPPPFFAWSFLSWRLQRRTHGSVMHIWIHSLRPSPRFPAKTKNPQQKNSWIPFVPATPGCSRPDKKSRCKKPLYVEHCPHTALLQQFSKNTPPRHNGQNPVTAKAHATHRVGSSQVNSESGVLCKGGDPAAGSPTATLLRLHPNHRPYRRRLPPLLVGPPASGKTDFRGVTGGVYKARERIHPGMLIQNY